MNKHLSPLPVLSPVGLTLEQLVAFTRAVDAPAVTSRDKVLAALPGAYCSEAPYGGGFRIFNAGKQVSQTCHTPGGAWRSAVSRL